MPITHFEPFIEAPTVRETIRDPITPSSSGTANEILDSGSNTEAFDHLRQGVSVRTDRHRYQTIQPKMGTGDPNHFIELVTFGQSKEFTDDTKWEELLVFDPVLFIQDQDALIFPVVLGNASLTDPERLGGVIEPLTIGVRALLVSPNADEEPHDVRGHIMDGNEDSFGKTSRVVDFIDFFGVNEPRDVFIDSSDNVGTAGGSIQTPGVFPEDEKIVRPFDDAEFASTAYIVSGSLTGTGSAEIENILSTSTGSNTARRLPVGARSLGAGFTYTNNPDGTDSLAFGGLKK